MNHTQNTVVPRDAAKRSIPRFIPVNTICKPAKMINTDRHQRWVSVPVLMAVAVCMLVVQAFGADYSTVVPSHSKQMGPDVIQATDSAKREIPLPLLKGSMEWQGTISGQEEELLTVITDAVGWTALWNRAFNREAPDVDFKTYAIACVFLGHHAGWLYDIHIGEPEVAGNMLIVPCGLSEVMLRLSGPFRASGQYRMKAVLKKEGYGIMLKMMAGSASSKKISPAFP